MTIATLVDGGVRMLADLAGLSAVVEEGGIVWDISLSRTFKRWDALNEIPLPSALEHARAGLWRSFGDGGALAVRTWIGTSAGISLGGVADDDIDVVAMTGTIRHAAVAARKGQLKLVVRYRVAIPESQLGYVLALLAGGGELRATVHPHQLSLPLPEPPLVPDSEVAEDHPAADMLADMAADDGLYQKPTPRKRKAKAEDHLPETL